MVILFKIIKKMRKKINSEIKFEYGNFKGRFGTMDKKANSTMYMELSTFIEPSFDAQSYSDSINSTKSKMQEKLKKNFIGNKIYEENFIFIFDVPEERICKEKKTYLSIQVCMKRKRGIGEGKKFKDFFEENSFENNKIIENIDSCLKEENYICTMEKG